MDDDRQLTDAPRYATLSDYTRVFRERWQLIAGCAVALAAIAFAFSVSQARTYEAETTLNARQRGADIGLLLPGTSSGPPVSPQALTAELAAMAERDVIARRTKRALRTPLSAEQIAARVSTSIDVQTNLVVLAARDEDGAFAARLANEYARQVADEAVGSERGQIDTALTLVRRQLRTAKREAVFPASDEVTILQERLNRLQGLKRIAAPVEVVTFATEPSSPVSPKPIRNTILALFAGLFLGVIAAFVRDSLDRRLKAPREIEDHFGLARVGQMSDLALGRSLLGQNGRRFDPVDLEAARIIRTNLDFLHRDRSLRSLVVTSPLPGEGKSTVSIALGWASVMAGRLTLLVECDLRQPVLADRLGLRRSPGLTDALLGSASPQEVLQMVDLGATSPGNGGGAASAAGHLVCITAGTPVPNPAEMLASDRFKGFLEKVTDAYDLVILDTSPMLSVVDTRELLPLADGVVVCARSYQTTRDEARATRDALDQISTPLAGLVVTGVRQRDDEYSGYYYDYAGGAASGR